MEEPAKWGARVGVLYTSASRLCAGRVPSIARSTSRIRTFRGLVSVLVPVVVVMLADDASQLDHDPGDVVR